MPEYTIQECDYCGKQLLEIEQKFLIYNIEFWNKKSFELDSKNFLLENNCALILCSEECIGKYIIKLSTTEKEKSIIHKKHLFKEKK